MSKYSIRLFGREFTLPISNPTNTDTMRYMHTGEDEEPTDPFEDADPELRKTHRVENLDDERLRIVRGNVEKIHRAAQSAPIATDEQVEGTMGVVMEGQSSEACYYFTAGPIAAEIPGLEWRTSYRVDLEDTVSVGSDEFRDVASEFDIPDNPNRELVPEFITAAYGHLVQLTERNDGQRAVHPWELANTGRTPCISEHNHSYAFEYVDKLPGVIPPERDGDAWVYITETDADATEESHA